MINLSSQHELKSFSLRKVSRLVRRLTNTGIFGGSDIIQRRRIRILNIFNLIATAIILTYFVVNVLIGTMSQAISIFSGLLILNLPVFYFHSRKLIGTAKIYFVLVAILFINLLAYKTLFQFPFRDNDFIMIGFSTLIIVLFDNPVKLALFSLNAGLAISLKIVRIYVYQPDTLLTDNILSILNMLTAFICVYFFTDIYKVDLLRSDRRIRSFAKKVERQNVQINIEKDKLFYNKYLLRTTIDNLPIFVALLDKKGHYIIVNNRFKDVILKNVDSIEGKHYTEILGPKVSEMAAPLFNRCLEGNESDIDSPITFQNGESIHAYGKYIPLKNHHGNVSRVLAYVTDIGDVKEIERQLLIANDSKDKILSILSHDLRGPLNSLVGLLDYADDIDPDKFKQMLKNVRQQVKTVNFTLENVLSWVKTQLGGFEAHTQHLDIGKEVWHGVDLYSEMLLNKSIGLICEIDENQIVKMDPDHLSIVMRNLLSNAIKFTPKKGTIEIGFERVNGHAYLYVKDSGMGMCEDTIAEVMSGVGSSTPRSRLGTDGERGTGLGLNFCMEILALNQASINIESAPNEGTKITVEMPLA